MAVRQIQSTFSLGELDPKLLARADFDGYYKGAQKLRNVLVIPQGGVKRRFGTLFGFMISDNAPTALTDSSEVSGILFDFSKTKTFLIIARPYDRAGASKVAFDIYLDDVLQATKTSTAYTIAQIAELRFLRAQDRVIILHESVNPQQLVRGANDATWTLSAITFANKPVFDFSLIDGTSYRAAGNTFTPSATGGVGITLTGSSAFFTAGHVGGLFIGNGGIARITAVNAGGTIATVTTLQDFDSTAAILGTNALLQEVAWGDSSGGTPAGRNRGWPSLGTFFQNRAILANSLTLPNILWASSSGDYYNFNDEEALDVDSFAIGIGSNGNEEIQDIIGTKALMAIGFSGVYSTSLFIDLPITPSNAFLTEQSRDGSAPVAAQIIDNQVFFVDENQQQISSALYDIATSSFNVQNKTLLSPQVIDIPVSSAAFRPSNADGSFYMVVNSDGTLAVFQSLLAQSIEAWTLSDTRGSFEQVIASRDKAYFVMRRSLSTGATVAGFADNIYTANEDFQAFTDIVAAASSAGTNVTLFANESDYIVIGHESPYYQFKVTLATPASASIVPTFEYLNNLGTWVAFTPTSDGSSGFSANGTIVWSLSTHTPNWKPMDLEAVTKIRLPADSLAGIPTKFWMRIRRTVSSLVTNPIESVLNINIANRVYMESVDFSEYMDSSIIKTSDANGLVTGLTHLVGQQVYVLGDDIPEGPYFVNASGQITIKSTSSSDVHVGLNYTPIIIPMPLIVQGSYPESIYHPKHLKSIFIDYFESLGITINGYEIPSLTLNNFVLDQAPIPVTNFYEITPMRGWDPRQKNTISQELPLPMTIIGIGYRLEMS